MPTLREYIEEGRARQARLDEAVAEGWDDAIPACRQTVQEWNWVMQSVLDQHMDRILEAAGDMHLGEMPPGHCLAYSKPGDWVDEVPSKGGAPKP